MRMEISRGAAFSPQPKLERLCIHKIPGPAATAVNDAQHSFRPGSHPVAMLMVVEWLCPCVASLQPWANKRVVSLSPTAAEHCGRNCIYRVHRRQVIKWHDERQL